MWIHQYAKRNDMAYLNTATLEKLTWLDIRKAHPNTSFPEGAWSDQLLAPFGYANLHFPEIVNDLLPYEEFAEGAPVLQNGKWYRSFTKQNVQVPQGEEQFFLDSEKSKIRSKIAAQRYAQEIGGTVVDDGNQIKFPLSTDRESQMMVTSTFTAMTSGVISTVNWKINSSSWITVDLPLVQLMANALAAHVQSCFTWEKNKLIELDAVNSVQALFDFARSPSNVILFRN